QLLQALDICTGVGWQLTQLRCSQGRLAPAGHFLVDRRQLVVAVSIGRSILQQLAGSVLVSDANLDSFQPIQNIQLGQAQTGDTVDLCSTTQNHGIKPAAAAGTPRGGAKLVTLFCQTGTNVIEQL